MKDDLGLYYYPNPQFRQARMYIRKNNDNIEFRLWNKDDPSIWERHGWLTLGIIKNAAKLYGDKEKNPLDLYDISVAEKLILEDES